MSEKTNDIHAALIAIGATWLRKKGQPDPENRAGLPFRCVRQCLPVPEPKQQDHAWDNGEPSSMKRTHRAVTKFSAQGPSRQVCPHAEPPGPANALSGLRMRFSRTRLIDTQFSIFLDSKK